MEIQKPWGLRQLCYRNPEAQKIPIHHPVKSLQKKTVNMNAEKSNKGGMSLVKRLKHSSLYAKVPKSLYAKVPICKSPYTQSPYTQSPYTQSL